MDHAESIQAVLEKRHDNGGDYWATADGRLGVGSPFSTLESLLILHELGVGADHEAVHGALDLLLAAWRPDGRYRLAPGGTLYPCYTANVARVLARFGHIGSERVQASLSHLLENQYQDGGWRCNKFSYGRGPETEFSNPGVTLFVLDAFRFTQGHEQSQALEGAIDTLLDHWTVRRPIGPCQFGIGTLFMQVEYPFLRYNLFSYVYVLSFYRRARQDGRFLEAHAALQSKLTPEGRIVVERPNRKLAKLKGFERGQPSAPATQRFKEIMVNMGQ